MGRVTIAFALSTVFAAHALAAPAGSRNYERLVTEDLNDDVVDETSDAVVEAVVPKPQVKPIRMYARPSAPEQYAKSSKPIGDVAGEVDDVMNPGMPKQLDEKDDRVLVAEAAAQNSVADGPAPVLPPMVPQTLEHEHQKPPVIYTPEPTPTESPGAIPATESGEIMEVDPQTGVPIRSLATQVKAKPPAPLPAGTVDKMTPLLPRGPQWPDQVKKPKKKIITMSTKLDKSGMPMGGQELNVEQEADPITPAPETIIAAQANPVVPSLPKQPAAVPGAAQEQQQQEGLNVKKEMPAPADTPDSLGKPLLAKSSGKSAEVKKDDTSAHEKEKEDMLREKDPADAKMGVPMLPVQSDVTLPEPQPSKCRKEHGEMSPRHNCSKPEDQPAPLEPEEDREHQSIPIPKQAAESRMAKYKTEKQKKKAKPSPSPVATPAPFIYTHIPASPIQEDAPPKPLEMVVKVPLWEPFTMNLQPDYTGWVIKQILHDRTGIHENDVFLFYKNMLVDCFDTLGSFNATEGSTIYCLVGCPPDPEFVPNCGLRYKPKNEECPKPSPKPTPPPEEPWWPECPSSAKRLPQQTGGSQQGAVSDGSPDEEKGVKGAFKGGEQQQQQQEGYHEQQQQQMQQQQMQQQQQAYDDMLMKKK